jgi:hypothetical protein
MLQNFRSYQLAIQFHKDCKQALRISSYYPQARDPAGDLRSSRLCRL